MTTRRTMVALTVAAAVGAAGARSAAETPRPRSSHGGTRTRSPHGGPRSPHGGTRTRSPHGGTFTLTTKSDAAREQLRELQDRVESFQGGPPADAVEPLRKLAADYPGERILYMLRGQNLAGLGRHDHYIAGYLKLEAGETAAAIEHLKQADVEDDPFHKLLLARAYEKSGQKDEAKKLYTEIVNFPQSNLERALAYREAKKRLAAL